VHAAKDNEGHPTMPLSHDTLLIKQANQRRQGRALPRIARHADGPKHTSGDILSMIEPVSICSVSQHTQQDPPPPNHTHKKSADKDSQPMATNHPSEK
jgi:hypothetical protein